MRGLEAALSIYGEVQKGAFASEALRRVYNDIAPGDRKLTATLLYCTLRRQTLWKTILLKYCRRQPRALPQTTVNALMVGIAGIVELRYFSLPVLVNGIVQAIKNSGEAKDIGLVNAVLHTVSDEAAGFLDELKRSSALRDQALYWGVPGWAAAQWSKELSIPEAKKLVRAVGMKRYLSLRLSRGIDRSEYIRQYSASGRRAWASPFLEFSVRTASNPYPVDLPGFGEGAIMPQSESSMIAAELLASYAKGGRILDMCCGRGVKTGQLADIMPDARIEAWDLSEKKINAARFEIMRMRSEERVTFKTGDALSLVPDEEPDAILLDVPCSGSGTWGRHPEGKWRLLPEDIEKNSVLQKKLLERAASMLRPGGFLLYSTCSLFREENEKVVADVMSRHPELLEMPHLRSASFIRKGKPYGTVIFPALPWVDGFYTALLAKRK
ncbi:MAG: RsmB/NOP family class I SAM-dependent RNA methyltransferase [Synergistes sp.]|nr:RsmB/NOP family class I SAM-dependent RNA methyltransferase [Synergistes sp.]